jgi:ribosomal protein S18 acetylase RimI-like enzyme
LSGVPSITELEVFSLNNKTFEQLQNLDQLCLPDQAWTFDAWKALTVFGENYGLWTISEHDNIVASMLVLNLPLEQMQHLLKIMVHPNYRKRGFAQKLIQTLKSHAEQLSCNSVMLEVEFDNMAAIGLYKAAGFTLTRRVRQFYRNGKDALVMNCTIHAIGH